ncbi:hypothetical protein [Humibacter ginsenosidimutans]|uniref:Holin n=1 Tax=Humibacter ginsenosidimutans TaxID=2599293 RepID=A0A5B8M396_9MICO|nr:hypothetical protein [Humibacter ginsenosidimutans]QDZ14756.1 hypothetical protein FPZ11_08295 [Humibacter ginsenosidimutans]
MPDNTTSASAVDTTPAEPVTLPTGWRTVIYCTAAPLAVGLFDLAGRPLDLPNILHAAATSLASLGAITAAAHISKK